MNQNDAYDRSIDEALRLATSGQPPAGYFERLQRRIEAAPETHRARGGLWLWVPAGCAVAAIFFAVILPVLLHSSKPGTIALAPVSHPAQGSKESSDGFPQRLKPHLVAALPGGLKPVPFKTGSKQHHAKRNKGAAKRNAANLFDYPLTHQEKLLVEFARTATPDELKELNPGYQARMEAKQEAEFAAYLKLGEDSGNSSMSRTGAEANLEVKTTQE